MHCFSVSQMPRPIYTTQTISISDIFFISSFLFNGVIAAAAAQDISMGIGAIIDVNSRIGKEENISMEIAVQAINKAWSTKQKKLFLHVIGLGGKPLQASRAAYNLIEGKQVQAIVGMETWPEAASVALVANEAQIPILSFATPSVASPSTSLRWPFLIKMANNGSIQMQCVASIVGSYGWTKVIAIYEGDGYSTDSGILTLLSDALQDVGSEIEHWLAFAPFSTLFDPTTIIQEQMKKLISKQSRVFIIVGASLELTCCVLKEAKDIGLMGKDSVWIATDSVTNLLHTINSSVMSSMQGIIGIKPYFSENTRSFKNFSITFHNTFRSIYPDEENSEPGIYALRAYDAISMVALAIEKSSNNSISSPTSGTLLLENILSSKFNGLTGRIRFKDMEMSPSTAYEIVNVFGKSYIPLKLWSPGYGFSDDVIDRTIEKNRSSGSGGGAVLVLGGRVYWPGGLERIPLGWVIPTEANPLIIGVPYMTTYEQFVKVNDGGKPTGFCIDVFNLAVKLLNYDLPHKFVPFYGTYDDLVNQVYFKRYGAVVGDITITANRSNFVEFTDPYAESSLTMVVPVRDEDKSWLVLMPFTRKLWIVVITVFLYTVFVIWFLEHRSNPDFRGPWRHQLSTAMWFTCSTIFFTHRESIRSNFTRVVICVWFFVVFVVTSSYTASLTSMLTVKQIDPTATTIETLKRTNSPVGCDTNSLLRKYLENVLGFDPNKIISAESDYDYQDLFKRQKIKAAFMELPYERVFLSMNSKDYQDAGVEQRFGGLGFVFPKGSPMARDFSKAFLILSEDGTLSALDQHWFKSNSTNSNSDNNMTNQSLGLPDFWGLFLVTILTSTIMLVLYIIHLFRRFRRLPISTTSPMEDNVWNGIKRLGTYFDNGRFLQSHRDPFSAHPTDTEVFISSIGAYMSDHTPPDPPVTEIEMAEAYIGDSNNGPRSLRLAKSFPGRDGRVHGFNHEWQHIPNDI